MTTNASHILINGRPLCDHMATQAGIQDRAKVDHDEASLCGHVWPESAYEVADAWQKAHRHLHVQVAFYPCPRTMRLAAEHTD